MRRIRGHGRWKGFRQFQLLAATLLLVLSSTGCLGGMSDRTALAQVLARSTAPGSTLPTDATCAKRVLKTPEDRPVNHSYNATTGSGPLPSSFFDSGSHDPRAAAIAARVSGSFTGTTPEILQWVACKWGLDLRVVRAQTTVESWREQTAQGDWTQRANVCAPGHGLGEDGRPGWCPESWGLLQVRYQYFSAAFPSAVNSTSYNVDTAYAVWRACYEGYELWLHDTAPSDRPYRPGDSWGCIGRWYSGDWYSAAAIDYIACVQAHLYQRECTT